MTVIVKKIGGSIAVVIPKTVARDMELNEGTALTLSATDITITMRKKHARKRRPLSQIVSEMNPAAYRRRNREMAESGPVGKELW